MSWCTRRPRCLLSCCTQAIACLAIAMPMDGGGVVVGDKVSVELEIEAVLRTA